MQTLEQLRSGGLQGTAHIKLSCGLTEFPQEIFGLADTLEILDLSGNFLTALPDDFDRLQKLRIVFFSDNLFTIFPKVLAHCPSLDIIGFKANQIVTIPNNAFPPELRWLILTNNRIAELPAAIGKCQRLQKCMLAGNRLESLPDSMADCQNLELLRISANRFESLPEWLLALPKLSWFAFAGNPFQQSTNRSNSLPSIDWHELELQQQLGQGASGIISKALWTNKGTGDPSEVAVKIFKGEITSDGLPADEMAACIQAGEHPNLVKVLGQITNHPHQKEGLVLGLIPQSYHNLGGPPSFETCTRDVFPSGAVFSARTIFAIARDMASTMAHLHAAGILHGDLYAHNILLDENDHALFGDFGAATVYDTFDTLTAHYLQRLEVRAFGCLIEDLLGHTDISASSKEFLIINDLVESCMRTEVYLRPSFKTVSEFFSRVNETS